MRTNIVIDDDLLAQAMQLSGLKTKRSVIERALRTLVRLERQRAVLELEGTITWEGDLDAWRTARQIMLEEPGSDARAR